MILDKPYNKELFDTFLKDFLPDYQKDERPVRTPDSSILTQITQLGTSREVDITVLEAECEETDTNKRISITQAAFKVLRNHGIRNAIVAFHDGNNQWRLSLLTSTLEIKDGKVIKKDSNPRRYSYLLGIGTKTVTAYKYLVDKGQVQDIKQLQERFSVEVVNKQFYASVAELFTKLVGGERGVTKHPGLLKINGIVNQNVEHQEFAVRLIGRVIFSWFLKEKKSAAKVPIVPSELLSLDAVASNADYYHSILEPLFFELLNKRVEHRHESLREAPFSAVPYLNGGLFSPQYNDFYNQNSFDGAGTPGLTHIPDGWFTELFTVLEQYNFTVDENTSYDVDLSIDPEMLGRIFENLLAEINPETGESARKSTGSFYTPREIVDYMVDSSLLEFLKDKTGADEKKLKALISWGQDDDELHPLTDAEKAKVVSALASLTILDPACGSGAFPIGILQKVVYVLQQVDEKAELWLQNQLKSITSPELRRDIEEKYRKENYDYLRKLGVIRESIFGVDIQTIATEISKLRCFLTLIIEEDVDDSAQNRGIRPLPNLDFKFVTANSLIGLPESNKSGKLNLFEDTTHIDRLKDIRNRYFGADADERARLQVEFKDLQLTMFRSRLASMGATSDLYNVLSDWNPFNHEKTEWFDSEWMFGVSKGFDIVIANPPYIDSEGMIKAGLESMRDAIAKSYKMTKGNWDIYIAFFELGFGLLSSAGTLAYITPDKWISKPFGNELRKQTVKNMFAIAKAGRKVFETAKVDSIISFIKNEEPKHLIISNFENGKFAHKKSIEKTILKSPYAYDHLFSEHLDFILKLEALPNHLLDLGKCENACATSDAYKLKPLVEENKGNGLQAGYLKIINTGTIGKYYSRWGIDRMTYLGDKYLQPVVNKDDFFASFPNSYSKKAITPKIILKGLNLLDACIDEEGFVIPGKTTLIVSEATKENLRVLLGILNSKLAMFYIKERYAGSSYNQGIGFTKDMINHLPMPTIEQAHKKRLIELVSQTLANKPGNDYESKNIEHDGTTSLENELNRLVYEIYGLTKQEASIIEEAIK
jgi:hypothetical protein